MEDEARQALGEVERQRHAAARLVRLPWWHPVLVTVCWTVLMVNAFPSGDFQRLGLPEFAYSLVGFVAGPGLIALMIMFNGRSAMHRPGFPRYPAWRGRWVPTLGLVVASLGIEIALYLVDGRSAVVFPIAVAYALLSGIAVAMLLCRINAGIRQNIHDGVAGP
jgi:hypothetical protein